MAEVAPEEIPTQEEGGEVVGDEAALHQEIGGEGAVMGEEVDGELVGGEELEGEYIEGEHVEVEGEHMEAEHVKGEHVEGEHVEGEHVEGEGGDYKEEVLGEGEELMGEVEGEQAKEEVKAEVKVAEEIVEEDVIEEEPPPDPTAPYNFSDSNEALREPFSLRPEQMAELEQLWALYQDYTPVYTDIKDYITEKELVYMLKGLLLMTYTPEQLQELIDYCVRPPHPEGHITFDQFVRMVVLRQRDFPIEEELRSALRVFDPGKTGLANRDRLKEVLATQGNKMPQRQLDNLIKEVDISNDGTIGIEDVIGTMCIDLNKEDLIMLRASVYPDQKPPDDEDEDI